MYALVDGNNFYVSCERVFQPRLKHRPVIVLSNNDGCAIARSEEAKALGIKMGAPWFQIERDFQAAGGVALSANFVLYGDMSRRMMQIALQMGERQEVYSIDETFVTLDGIDRVTQRAHVIRGRIQRWIGIPSCIGIGPTKTLAKLANHIAKDAHRKPGSYPADLAHVCNLCELGQNDMERLLQATPVGEVWGIGRRIGQQLKQGEIENALQLANLDAGTVRRRWSVQLERTIRELRGQSCIELEDVAPDKQQIACTRSFGQKVTSYLPLEQAITEFTCRAAEKLRQQSSRAASLLVLIHTSPFEQKRAYSNSVMVPLRRPTDQSQDLVHAAIAGLRAIYKAGYRYARAGVMLLDLQGPSSEQFELALDETHASDSLMQALDAINDRYGMGTVRLGSAGVQKQARQWDMKQERRSARFTTDLDGLPVAG